MKKITILTLALLSFAANALNQDFFDQVIIYNVDKSIDSAKRIDNSIKQGDIKQSKALFTQLVVGWKAVETTYVLGDLNEDFLDTPRYIDIFHGNNENIHTQLDLIIKTGDDLKYALYKNSHKSINALEYLLFTQDLTNDRVQKMAQIMANSIHNYLIKIKAAYQNYGARFIKDEQFASAILLNTFVANAYALKEWRIGDAAGMSKKYRSKPSANRAEYALSQNSVSAILSILQTYKQAIDSPSYKNFGNVAKQFGAAKEIKQTIDYLNQAIKQAKTMQEADLASDKGRQLYQITSKLMQSYYLSLMDKLGFVSKVLDADGD